MTGACDLLCTIRVFRAFAVALFKPALQREWRGVPACLIIAVGHTMVGWDALGWQQLPVTTASLLMIVGGMFGLADGISAGIKGELKTDAQNKVELYYMHAHGKTVAEAKEIKRAYASLNSNCKKMTIPTRMIVAGIADATSMGTSALVFAGLALLDAAALLVGRLGDGLGSRLHREDDRLSGRRSHRRRSGGRRDRWGGRNGDPDATQGAGERAPLLQPQSVGVDRGIQAYDTLRS